MYKIYQPNITNIDVVNALYDYTVASCPEIQLTPDRFFECRSSIYIVGDDSIPFSLEGFGIHGIVGCHRISFPDDYLKVRLPEYYKKMFYGYILEFVHEDSDNEDILYKLLITCIADKNDSFIYHPCSKDIEEKHPNTYRDLVRAGFSCITTDKDGNTILVRNPNLISEIKH